MFGTDEGGWTSWIKNTPRGIKELSSECVQAVNSQVPTCMNIQAIAYSSYV